MTLDGETESSGDKNSLSTGPSYHSTREDVGSLNWRKRANWQFLGEIEQGNKCRKLLLAF